MMLTKLVIVADDFTGANDTGVQFANRGLKVNVILDFANLQQELINCDVLVVDLESRMDTSEMAYHKSFSLGKQLAGLDKITVYKKLDSTLRGNIGAEIDGLMDALQLKFTFFASALPRYGRTVQKGVVYVNGVKLGDTEVARDPRTPVTHSRIADIINLQSSRNCVEIGITETKNADVSKAMEAKNDIFIFDTSNEQHLEDIAGLIENIKDEVPLLIAGSAGLAAYLNKFNFSGSVSPVFVFAGSVSERSGQQVQHAVAQGNCELVIIKGEKLLDGHIDEQSISDTVTSAITNGTRRFIFTTASGREDVDIVFKKAAARSYSQDQAAAIIAAGLGRIAARLIEKFQPTAALLTGGETAINTVLALQATGIAIDREIIPGIQSGMLTGSKSRTIIVTKSGGFGDIDAISKTFEHFKV